MFEYTPTGEEKEDEDNDAPGPGGHDSIEGGLLEVRVPRGSKSTMRAVSGNRASVIIASPSTHLPSPSRPSSPPPTPAPTSPTPIPTSIPSPRQRLPSNAAPRRPGIKMSTSNETSHHAHFDNSSALSTSPSTPTHFSPLAKLYQHSASVEGGESHISMLRRRQSVGASVRPQPSYQHQQVGTATETPKTALEIRLEALVEKLEKRWEEQQE